MLMIGCRTVLVQYGAQTVPERYATGHSRCPTAGE